VEVDAQVVEGQIVELAPIALMLSSRIRDISPWRNPRNSDDIHHRLPRPLERDHDLGLDGPRPRGHAIDPIDALFHAAGEVVRVFVLEGAADFSEEDLFNVLNVSALVASRIITLGLNSKGGRETAFG
jgi:hypothetical protein